MADIPESALFLVCILPEQRDLDIVRLLGWYRIPIKSSPKIVDVDYLAFYQTKSFGLEHQWKIEYYSPVRGHELVTRKELFQNEPDHKRANEEYFKIVCGSVEKLPHPIISEDWKRITFLYTTGELINSARTINDLVIRSESRQLFWKTLRERITTEEVDETPNELSVDNQLIFEALLQWIDINTDTKRTEKYG